MTADSRRGECCVCHRQITVLKDGSIRIHGSKTGVWPPRNCGGSWRRPAGKSAADTPSSSVRVLPGVQRSEQ